MAWKILKHPQTLYWSKVVLVFIIICVSISCVIIIGAHICGLLRPSSSCIVVQWQETFFLVSGAGALWVLGLVLVSSQKSNIIVWIIILAPAIMFLGSLFSDHMKEDILSLRRLLRSWDTRPVMLVVSGVAFLFASVFLLYKTRKHILWSIAIVSLVATIIVLSTFDSTRGEAVLLPFETQDWVVLRFVANYSYYGFILLPVLSVLFCIRVSVSIKMVPIKAPS